MNVASMSPRMLLALLLAALLSGLAGCVTVQPWQRETLSNPCMDLSPRLGDGLRTHVVAVREGALGGGGGIGGGCGCN